VLILLPPSETKREGGDAERALDLASLSFPELAAPRRAALAELRSLSTDLTAAVAALKLGPKGAGEAARNREVRRAPVMPAIDRFDGVLFDALDAASLSPAARERAGRLVVVQSALFGLVGALDEIPEYRLSHDSRLPGRTLKTIWRGAGAAVLAERTGLLLDLRSEGYAALSPLPERPDAVFVRVVSDDGSGPRRALNHFNKHGKGVFVRRLLESGAEPDTVPALLEWAAGERIRLEPGAPARRGRPAELDLVAESLAP
jgi:uncharacterized protein